MERKCRGAGQACTLREDGSENVQALPIPPSTFDSAPGVWKIFVMDGGEWIPGGQRPLNHRGPFLRLSQDLLHLRDIKKIIHQQSKSSKRDALKAL